MEQELEPYKKDKECSPFFISREMEERYYKEKRKLLKQFEDIDSNARHMSELIEEINKIEVI